MNPRKRTWLAVACVAFVPAWVGPAARGEVVKAQRAVRALAADPRSVGRMTAAAPTPHVEQEAVVRAKLDAFVRLKSLEIGRRGAPESPRNRPAVAAAAPAAPAPAPPPLTTVESFEATPRAVRFLTRTVLGTDQTSTALNPWGEPSLAVRGDDVFVTFNIQATHSGDGGTEFHPVNPTATFEPALVNNIDGPFYGDQVALYEPNRDAVFWLMQQHRPSMGKVSLKLRLAIAGKDDVARQEWPQPYSLTPNLFSGTAAGDFFDFPDLAFTANFLYLSCNIFKADQTERGTLVTRLPLDALVKRETLPDDLSTPPLKRVTSFLVTDVVNLRLAQGATDTMYIGTHTGDGRHVRVYSWKDADENANVETVEVGQWYSGERTLDVTQRFNWLGSSDGRVTAAWVTGDQVGFGWSAAQDFTFPLPHVRVVTVKPDDTTSKIAEYHLWNRNYAFGYPAVAPTADGTALGMAVLYGGGWFGGPSTADLSFAVGTLDASKASSSVSPFSLKQVAHGPISGNRSGDYLTVRPHPKDKTTWVTAGYVPRSSRIQLQYVQFGQVPPLPSGPVLAGAAAAPANAEARRQADLDAQFARFRQDLLQEIRQLLQKP